MTDPATLDRIRHANPLEAVMTGDGVALKQKGKELFGLCPFHDDHTPSLRVNPDKQAWYCDPCGKGGDVFKWEMEKHALNFPQAVEKLAARAGITLNGDGNRRQVAPVVRGCRNPLPVSSCPSAPASPDPQARAAVTVPEPDAAFADGFAKRLGVSVDTIRKLIADGALGCDKARAIAFACQNPDGSIAALHLRGEKTDGGRWFAWTPEGCTAGLWRLPAATRADKVIVTEGETDAIAALDAGLEAEGFAVVAKTGAGIFPDDALPVFAGKTVFVIPDNDKAGREGASKTAAKLAEVATVHVAALPEMPDGRKDLRDWFALGNDYAALLALLDKARLPAADVITEPMQPARYGLPKSFCYGLGGWIADYFALFEPRTEPSYAFHLAGALSAMDTLLGRRVFWQFGNTTLFAQDYYLLAGSVAAARKSTALSCAARVIRCLETESTPYRMAEGFSYEALPDEFQEWPLRLLLLDEFSSLLVQQQKDYGKGIAQTLNSMWQGVDKIRLRFRGRDKGKAVVIENPVLTILAATSLEMLQANLRAGDHGGFTSRLLPFYAEGDSKDLPEPQPIEQHEAEKLAGELRRLCEGVSGAARWTPDAAALWAEWYRHEKRNAAANPSGFASRKGDHVRKLALKLQVSKDGKLEIGDTALADAITIADKAATSWQKIFGAGILAGGFIAAKATEALDWIRRHACPEGLPYWQISKALRFDPKTAETVIATLELWGEIHTETRATGGTPQRRVWPKAVEATGKKEIGL